MKCPKCQFENPDGAKFCNECGNKLKLVCPGCGRQIPVGSKFCNECSQKLKEVLEAEEKAPEAEGERIGEILLNIDNQHIPDAEDWVKKAIETDSRNDMMLHIGRDYALYADIFKRRGDKSNSRKNLIKATEIFKCGANGYLKKAEEKLTSFS